MQSINVIRYPGGKQKLLEGILPYLPKAYSIRGKYIEPFLGGGSVFFAMNPDNAVLSDINPELINLFKSIQTNPLEVWNTYQEFGSTAEAYYQVRDLALFQPQDNIYHAAKLLYLNRTSYKGIMRYNKKGRFNISYGDQKRRDAISYETLIEASGHLKNAQIKTSDFEKIIDQSQEGDFLFLDPPYQPGEINLKWNIYLFCSFSLNDHIRLAKSLKAATKRNVKWAMTTTSHPDILSLFEFTQKINLPKGTGKKLGIPTEKSGEILITNL